MSQAVPEISVILPCLDEEAAVGSVVDDAWEGIKQTGRTGEVIVVDNGSRDRSAEVATAHGATVVHEPRRGYGSAYLAGLARARGAYVVMGDADGTYPMQEIDRFVAELEAGNDVVLGSRFDGVIHEGSMPWSHRWIGNPVLTRVLNVLFGIRVSDAHCGMRAVRRSALPVLDLHSTGMEFASEMVFKAARRGLRTSELPIDYFVRKGDSKLNRFSDAWRHIRFMLVYSPSWLYFAPGAILFVVGFAGLIALAFGPIEILGRTWQIHTSLACIAAILVGGAVVQLGVFARTYALVHLNEHDPIVDRFQVRLRLEHGLLLGAAVFLAGVGILAFIFVSWATNGFGALGHVEATALGFTLIGLGVQIVLGSFFLSLLVMRHTPTSTASE